MASDPSPLTAEQIAELRRLLRDAPLGPWYVGPDSWVVRDRYDELVAKSGFESCSVLIVAAVNALPALLALAERPSNAEGAAALLRKLSAGESGGWQPIESAPKDREVIAVAIGKNSALYGIVRGGAGVWLGWHWVPEPTHWMPLPESPK